MSRSKLPFRKKSEGFFFYKGKILAKDEGDWVRFPGGGIDPGESRLKAVKRETKEETGATLDSCVEIITVTEYFTKEWAKGNPKRQKRYKKFQGSKITIFVGRVKSLGKPTSDEGDAWTGKMFLPISKCIKLSEGSIHTPRLVEYRTAQIAVLKMLKNQKKFKF